MKYSLFRALVCFFFSAAFSLKAEKCEIDKFFEKTLSKTSILNTQNIRIPHYSSSYNPSLIPYKGGYLLSFRYTSRCPDKYKENFKKTDLSFIGLARLDKSFKVLEKSVQLLNLSSHSEGFSLTAEDGRLHCLGDRIFLVFNDLPMQPAPGDFAMYLGEIKEEQGIFVLKEPAKLLKYSLSRLVEKNWSPFSVGDKLYLIYSDQPRVILEVDLLTGDCQEISRTDMRWDWDFGEIRGGTPAVVVNDTFLTFFHSSFPAKTSKGRAYVMGAYTFDKEPPFTVQTVTPQPLGKLKDYTDGNPLKIIFPCGMVVEDEVIHVAWGKGDKKICITTFDRQKLLSSMEPYSK